MTKKKQNKLDNGNQRTSATPVTGAAVLESQKHKERAIAVLKLIASEIGLPRAVQILSDERKKNQSLFSRL